MELHEQARLDQQRAEVLDHWPALFGGIYRRLIDDHQLPAEAALSVVLAYLQRSVRDVNLAAGEQLLDLAMATSQAARALGAQQQDILNRLNRLEIVLDLGGADATGEE